MSQVVVLLADPDPDLAVEAGRDLAAHGVSVTTCRTGAEALMQAGRLGPDAVLLAATLPDIHAVDVVKALHEALPARVLLGAGPADAQTALEALAVGAAAVVARPYRTAELMPYLDGVRAEHEDSDDEVLLRVGPIELDAATYEVRVDGRQLALPLREFELLRYLMRRADRVVTREDIARDVWNRAEPIATNTINVHVKRLRRRLGDGSARMPLIRTVRGVGFRLVRPD